MNERVNLERLAQVVRLAQNADKERSFPFENGDLNPEQGFIELTQKIAAEKQAPHLPLNALFFITSLVYAEKTTPFFERITSESLIQRYSWLFDPGEVVERGKRLTTLAARNFIRPRGYNVAATKEWYHNSAILHEMYGDKVANLFESLSNDAGKIYDALVIKPQTKGKVGIRRYGEKLSALLLQWVSRYQLHPLHGSAGVPIDFQIGRIAIQTGAIETSKPIHKNTATRILRTAFNQVTQMTGVESGDISRTIYTIGSQACSLRAHDKCPLKKVCTTLISREPYDRKGVFDPRDTGRYST